MNYRCKKCGRYVREEEQTSNMKAKKLCNQCILWEDAPRVKNMFGEWIR